MNTYFYLSGKNKNAKGLCPIVCRVTANGEPRDEFRTGIFIEPEHWDSERATALNNYRDIGSRLTIISNKIYALIADCEREEIFVPAEVVRRWKDFKNPKKNTVEQIAADLIAVQKLGEVSREKIDIATRQFTELTSGVLAKKVTTVTLQTFVSALQPKLAPTTIQKKLEFIKRVFVYGKQKGYIHVNPFDGYKIPKAGRVEPVQCTLDELKLISEHHFASERLEYVKDLFLFQCATGLSYQDLFTFNKEKLTEVKDFRLLKGKRGKSKEEYIVPWFSIADTIALRYNYSFERISNQKYNSYLKEVADIVGIKKNLTTHVGRKTFSQIMVDSGYTAESVSKMMGHASFNMTQKHYARIGETRIINETMKLAS